MKEIRGNILDINEGVICHQVNCRRVAGAGLALQIRNRWPAWYESFLRTTPKLGKCGVYTTSSGVRIANFYSQDGYGRGRRQTSYDAFRKCCKLVYEFANVREETVYLPVGIGCGLAGGDWRTVLGIIEEELPEAILVKYGGKT